MNAHGGEARDVTLVTLVTCSLYGLGEGRGQAAKEAAVERPLHAGGLGKKAELAVVDEGVSGTKQNQVEKQAAPTQYGVTCLRPSSSNVRFLCF